MNRLHRPRARWLVLATLGMFATLVPAASADTGLPLWTCRGSAGYIELDPLLGPQRIEPVVANGFADRDAPDAPQCTTQTQGVPDITLPPPAAGAPDGLSVRLQAPFARTTINPQVGFARDQDVTATGGVVDPLTITIGGFTITANAVSAEASADCSGTTPVLRGSSTVVELSIDGGPPITLPGGTAPSTIDLSPLVSITFNEVVSDGDATSADQSLTHRALHIRLLALPGDAQPVANVVVGEAKVDRHGAVCAPPPAPPVCPNGATAQDPSANPLVCVLPVTAPCPTGSTADPNAGNACVIVRQVGVPVPVAAPCPAGSTATPSAGGACVIVRQTPLGACPTGATRDPATNNCIVLRNTGSGADGNGNGVIAGTNNQAPTCGRLEMHFVRGGKRSLTNRFGNRVVTRGRLVTCGSNPRSIVGARIDVVHVLPDGRRLRKTGLRTRAVGRATLILPLDLRSRRIEYAYRPDLTSDRVTSRVNLRLTVRNRAGRVVR
ncbi:MAG TPA: hypothetical protein VMY78_04090 [Solirubrobacteraceae bacterium]|nr:hypothetical protein [Solirubrobacteraceae bacterium]